ncbi:MAG TPA: radical SAM protein [Candidatus Methylomirabilis sp.]|nr:radical SAM protein [Candidatus Methylomirabilis sp.]
MKPGVPAPSLAPRIGEVVDQRRGVDFHDLNSRNLMNRLTGASMPFGWTVNPYRGCELGCRYCYARATHEYLGHCAPEEFEQHIYVKRAEAGRLVADLCRAREAGQEVAIGTATDPYQPAEARFHITRGVLEVISRVPGLRVGITTKSSGIARDLDLLLKISKTSTLQINFSLISLDADLLRLIEPRAPRPDLRLRAMRALSEAGVATRLFIMPVLPLITDGRAGLSDLLRAARSAGAAEAICQVLFLRTPMVRAFFMSFVEREFPWLLDRYRELYPTPGSAPRDSRARVERLVDQLARDAGFSSRSREERVRDESPPRSPQLSLVW